MKARSEFVYVNQDGSVRAVSEGEAEYITRPYENSDGDRPYVKETFESRDGWGSLSGFLAKDRLPQGTIIHDVHPDYDERLANLENDYLGSHKAAGDTIEYNSDGSVSCSPNPGISHEKRVSLIQEWELEQQRRREALAKEDVE